MLLVKNWDKKEHFFWTIFSLSIVPISIINHNRQTNCYYRSLHSVIGLSCIRFCFLYNSRKEYNRAIRRINLFPLESTIGFPNAYHALAIVIFSAIQLLNNWQECPLNRSVPRCFYPNIDDAWSTIRFVFGQILTNWHFKLVLRGRWL